jgi:hypothetical protein
MPHDGKTILCVLLFMLLGLSAPLAMIGLALSAWYFFQGFFESYDSKVLSTLLLFGFINVSLAGLSMIGLKKAGIDIRDFSKWKREQEKD